MSNQEVNAWYLGTQRTPPKYFLVSGWEDMDEEMRVVTTDVSEVKPKVTESTPRVRVGVEH